MTNCGGAVNERMRKRFPSGRRGGRTGAEAGERAETAPEKRRAWGGRRGAPCCRAISRRKRGRVCPYGRRAPELLTKCGVQGNHLLLHHCRFSDGRAHGFAALANIGAVRADRAQPLDAGRFGLSAQQPAGPQPSEERPEPRRRFPSFDLETASRMSVGEPCALRDQPCLAGAVFP